MSKPEWRHRVDWNRSLYRYAGYATGGGCGQTSLTHPSSGPSRCYLSGSDPSVVLKRRLLSTARRRWVTKTFAGIVLITCSTAWRVREEERVECGLRRTGHTLLRTPWRTRAEARQVVLTLVLSDICLLYWCWNVALAIHVLWWSGSSRARRRRAPGVWDSAGSCRSSSLLAYCPARRDLDQHGRSGVVSGLRSVHGGLRQRAYAWR